MFHWNFAYFRSNPSNKQFQKILKAREEHISSVNQKATAQLAQLSQNKAEYQKMLEKLWTQEWNEHFISLIAELLISIHMLI